MYGESLGSLGTNGPEPTFFNESNEHDWLDRAQEVVARMTSEEGIEQSQITVLCTRSIHVERLRERYAGDCPLVEPGGRGVVVETVHRFKGLESPVVVLILGNLDLDVTANRALTYVGMSRARSGLYVVGAKLSATQSPGARASEAKGRRYPAAPDRASRLR